MPHHKVSSKSGIFTPKLMRAFAPLVLLLTLVVGSLPTAHAVGPTVSVSSPTEGAVHKDAVTLSATVGADTQGVTFKVVGPMVSTTFAEDTTAPYSVSWDSTAGLNKLDYTITAVARSAGGSTTSAPVKIKLDNAPFPDRVIVVGDSVTQQAFDPNADGTFSYTANAPTVANRGVFAAAGWAVPQVQDTVNNYSIFRWPERLVVAMGLNDASTLAGDGWNTDDLNRFRTLINTPQSNTCVVLVLPGHAATGSTPWFSQWATEIDQARADLTQLATERPRTMLIDWQTVIDQNPQYMDEDGIHLLTPNTNPDQDLALAAQGQIAAVEPAAAAARQEFYWNGAAQCESPSATFQPPAGGAPVVGSVPLAVTATKTQSVQFKVDGVNIGSPVTSAPFQLNWDSTTMPNGSPMLNGNHTITAVSTSQVGSHTATVTVNVQNPPLPGTVEVVGDSITFQAVWYHGFLPTAPASAGLDVHAWLGWKVQDVQSHVTEKAAQRWPETLIIALGTNDSAVVAGGDGWTQADLQHFRTLINTVHPATKIALVLPGYGLGINPAHAAQQDLAKQALTALATERPHTIVVSWQDKITADPSIMDPDGIHLKWEDYTKPDGTPDRRVTAHAAGVRQQLYWDAWQFALQN